MTKKLSFLTLFVLLFLSVFVRSAEAREGQFVMTSDEIKCVGSSIWQGSRYKVLGKCQGLVYPYKEKLDHYSFWIKPDSVAEPLRVGDVKKGIIDGTVSKTFSNIFLTAEETSSPYSPSGVYVISGGIEPFDFSEVTGDSEVDSEGVPAFLQVDDEVIEEPKLPGEEPEKTTTIAPTSEDGGFMSKLSGDGKSATMPIVVIVVLLVIIIGAVVTFRK